jgi:S1-C subfamily serine protease
LACLAALAFLAILTLPKSSKAAEKPGQTVSIQTAADTFLADKPIRVERFEPATLDKCPAIIVVPAVDGVDAHGPLYREQAKKYAGQGYVVLIVHYFDRTGGTKENRKALQESFRLFFDPKAVKTPEDVQAMRRHFATWVDTVRQALPATVMVLREHGERIVTGSGVLVDRQRKWVLTNYHVTGDDKSVVVLFPNYDAGGNVIAERDAYFMKVGDLIRLGRLVKGHVMARDLRRDLALLELEQVPEDARAIRLAVASPRPGQRVHSVGSPGASDALWLYTQGTVRMVYSRKYVVDGEFEVHARVVEAQSLVNPGDSGGPVVNDRGELVAVVESARVAHHGGDVHLLSIFIDVSEVKTFLKRHAPEGSWPTPEPEERGTVPATERSK